MTITIKWNDRSETVIDNCSKGLIEKAHKWMQFRITNVVDYTIENKKGVIHNYINLDNVCTISIQGEGIENS